MDRPSQTFRFVAEPLRAPRRSDSFASRPFAFALLVAVLGLAAATSRAEASGFDPETDGARVSEMLVRREFSKLEEWYARLRAEKGRSETGGWLTARFFDAVEKGARGTSPASEERFLAAFLDWKKKHPRSMAAHVALADAYTAVAWAYRGSGLANTVSESGWKDFHRNIEKGLEVFAEAEKLPDPDPRLYEAGIVLATAASRPEKEAWAMFEKGAAIEPCYLSLHRAMAGYLSPRWHGSPEKVREFAERSVELTREREGESYYLRAAGNVHASEAGIDWDEYGFDWARVSRGWDDYHRLWPDGPGFRDFVAWMACREKDQEKARELFELLPPTLPEKPLNRVWTNAAEYEAFRNWARGEAEYPTSNDLVDAILADDESTALTLVANGVSIEARGADGHTALAHAAGRGMPRLAEAMLKKGADPNRAGTGGWLPIHSAARARSPRLVRALAEAGAELDRPETSGNTALMQALQQNDGDTIAALLEAGAGPNVPGRDGWTPLCTAIYMKYFDLADLLLDAGAKADLAMPGWNPLLLAARSGSLPLVRRLLKEGAPPDEPVASGETALMGAASQGHGEIVLELVATGKCDLGRKDSSRNTPLHWAAIMCGPDAVRALLEAGADPSIRNRYGQTPLAAARMRPSAKANVAPLEEAEARRK